MLFFLLFFFFCCCFFVVVFFYLFLYLPSLSLSYVILFDLLNKTTEISWSIKLKNNLLINRLIDWLINLLTDFFD